MKPSRGAIVTLEGGIRRNKTLEGISTPKCTSRGQRLKTFKVFFTYNPLGCAFFDERKIDKPSGGYIFTLEGHLPSRGRRLAVEGFWGETYGHVCGLNLHQDSLNERQQQLAN